MIRASFFILFALIGSLNAFSQTLVLADLSGSWYFHQHYVDSFLFADVDKPTPFPKRDFEMMKQAATASGAQSPDSATYAAMIRKNEENYRRYRIDVNSDSTYVTELAAGMSKWLPVKGRFVHTYANDGLHMLDENGTVVSEAIEIKDAELRIALNGPLNTLLLFRREAPEP